MFLLIFESISTTELVIIGIIALVVFGPRKLPELGRKAGRLMAEFRSATNDFKSTWEKEVAELKEDAAELNNDARMLSFLENPQPVSNSISRSSVADEDMAGISSNGNPLELPAIKEVSPSQIDLPDEGSVPAETAKETKKDWL